MNTVAVGAEMAGLPEEVEVAVFTLRVTVDSREAAIELAQSIYSNIKAEFSRRYPRVGLFYDLEFEITSVHPGTWNIVTKAKLVLKRPVRFVKKNAPKIALFGWGLLIGYKDAKGGIIEIYNDLRPRIEQEVGDSQAGKTGEVCVIDFEKSSPLE